MSTAEERIDMAMNVIERYGSFEGDHHKQWVLDQVVRALLGQKGYEEWVSGMNDNGGDYDPWDAGIAP